VRWNRLEGFYGRGTFPVPILTTSQKTKAARLWIVLLRYQRCYLKRGRDLFNMREIFLEMEREVF